MRSLQGFGERVVEYSVDGSSEATPPIIAALLTGAGVSTVCPDKPKPWADYTHEYVPPVRDG